MRIIGLTGGIACGKSSVSHLLSNMGAYVIDCDKIAHEACAKGSWGYNRIVQAFGREVLGSNGDIDREALSCLIFQNVSARRKLNTATHLPIALELIRQIICSWLSFRFLVVVDMPLLFETGAHKWMNMTILVCCKQEIQVERLMNRDKMSQTEALNRISSQLDQGRKMELANMILDNNGSKSDLEEKVKVLVTQISRNTTAWGLLTSPLTFSLLGFSIIACLCNRTY
ncbi:hypothetical protein CEUSTIGMA_g11632.t1 [Chlamydomonas eustigma]|uniref:Dephospho-CoA kinase n=1 Tax=Chlamydomonas eustigma TaxID=1157962 RepID=A0A250XMQ5_9CHLO|nr:hypothetical protein CEUSTIGMA_g11632.t1 [Chlamydomonas eustigma]|eukprot:GAX84209.1 hypothetical protein CEUSTIGMA_g11632.t1 [Chlamydomonas eustigma]